MCHTWNGAGGQGKEDRRCCGGSGVAWYRRWPILENGACVVPPARLRHWEATCGIPADACQSCLLRGNSARPTEAELGRRYGGSGTALGAFFEKRGLRRGGDGHQRGCGIGRRRVASQLMHANHACCRGTAPGRLRPSSGGVTVGLALLLARFLKNGACAVVVMATSAVAALGGDV